MTRTAMQWRVLSTAAIVTLGTLALVARVQAQGAAPPDLSGTYRCQQDPTPCMWSGEAPSISQTGNKLDIKNDKGEVAAGTLTSNITISVGGPMNSYGVVRPDHSIEWSNGNKWTKQ
jgi:hypothetical protein